VDVAVVRVLVAVVEEACRWHLDGVVDGAAAAGCQCHLLVLADGAAAAGCQCHLLVRADGDVLVWRAGVGCRCQLGAEEDVEEDRAEAEAAASLLQGPAWDHRLQAATETVAPASRVRRRRHRRDL